MEEQEVYRIIEQAARDGRTTLYLDAKQLTSVKLPAKIGTLTNLNQLYLSMNYLTSLPAELGNLTYLTHLYLANNELTSIPAELGNLTCLSELYLGSNRLTSIPAELGNLTELRVLNLHGNQLSSIPSELGNLTNLTQLDLANNQLTSVPAELGNLTNLYLLWLQGNQLTSVPTELGNLTNLTKLLLYNNPLESPPANVLEQGTEAVLAYLRSNKIKFCSKSHGQDISVPQIHADKKGKCPFIIINDIVDKRGSILVSGISDKLGVENKCIYCHYFSDPEFYDPRYPLGAGYCTLCNFRPDKPALAYFDNTCDDFEPTTRSPSWLHSEYMAGIHPNVQVWWKTYDDKKGLEKHRRMDS
jgi:Leucine-rich repeat (LRR) protein